MPSEFTFLFTGTVATLGTLGYFLETHVPDAKRALFGLAASYLWGVWAFGATEVYVAQLPQSPLNIRPLFFAGLGFSFIMLALSLHRALKVLTRSDGNDT